VATTAAITVAVAIAISVGLPAGGLLAQDEPAAPFRVRAGVIVLNTPLRGSATVFGAGGTIQLGGTASGSGLLSMAIDRWSTTDETAKLSQALKSGGARALTSALERTTVGSLHLNGDLRVPIRLATTWKTDEGQVVRLAMTGEIVLDGSSRVSHSTDYPISIIEFTLPPEGRGEGSLVAVREAEFDNRGRIAALSTPLNTGVQRLTNVEIEPTEKSKP
jgi:hypothetical protein